MEAPTTRQREVLTLLASGLTERQVARQLGVAYDTVRAHVEQVRERLRVNNVTAAVALAIMRGWINPVVEQHEEWEW